MANGLLFTEDFLNEGVRETEAYRALNDETVAAKRAELAAILGAVSNRETLVEAQTENRIVQPVLEVLGFAGAYDVQAKLDTQGRENVPDYLLYADREAFARAEAAGASREQRIRHASVVGDAKAWRVPLSGRPNEAKETPAGQILRYLTRAEVMSERGVKWGVLTNGRYWRLYHQYAKSRLEEYYEADLAWLLDLADDDLFTTGRDKLHELKLFLLIFSQRAFQRGGGGRTFLELALEEGRRWEAKVRTSLSDVVFNDVFPGLVRALADADTEKPEALTAAYLEELREAALTLLYRLLFALYAEDRDLLPRKSREYDGLSRIREEIRERIDNRHVLSGRRVGLYHRCVELFDTIDTGDDDLGVPPYNGGLFAHERSPLLRRSELSDKVFAPLFDKLSRTQKEGRGHVLINYRDLSVRELGAIYERLLEFQPVADADQPSGIGIRANAFARKGSGSYYTPDELVQLIIQRAVGPLVDERKQAFHDRAEALRSDTRPKQARRAELEALDPASRILELKIVDPAMGSGHFLVSLIDYLADEIHRAIGQAAEEAAYCDYVSPLNARLDAVRQRIREKADARGWGISEAQLEDKNLVKRFALKRCIYGVDKNEMAVELAKVALWLHTFTAGAPLSFLDHHLRCGDSLFGERVRKVMDELAGGGLFINQSIQAAQGAAAGMLRIEALTDAELGEVQESEQFYEGMKEATRPLRRFLSFWHALRWLKPLPEDEKAALNALLGGRFGDPIEVAAALRPPNPPANLSAEQLALLETATTEPDQLAMFGAASAGEWRAAKRLIKRAHELAEEQRFFHWEVAFPGVLTQWESAVPNGGFDAVIGNPPWDQLDFEQTRWFELRDRDIALANVPTRAAIMAAHERNNSPLWADFRHAADVAGQMLEVSGTAYKLFGGRKSYLHALFVEQSLRLRAKKGSVGLLVPVGVVTHKSAVGFLEHLREYELLSAVIDFENGDGPRGAKFFPDVHTSFKFCALILASGARQIGASFFTDISKPINSQMLEITWADIETIDPDNRLLPLPDSARSFRLLLALQKRWTSFAGRFGREVGYSQMVNRATDADKFVDLEALNILGAYPVEMGRYKTAADMYLPLLEGKIAKMWNHRGSSVVRNRENILRPGTLWTRPPHSLLTHLFRSRRTTGWQSATTRNFRTGNGTWP